MDAVGDTYEFHDNGVFLPGSTVSNPQVKAPDDYVSWTVPVAPPEGSDIASIELIRHDAGLTVTTELVDRWVPFPNVADPDSTWAPGDPLSGSSVTVSMSRDGWGGWVVIEDSAADTILRGRASDSLPEDQTEIILDPPTFDGNRATVRIPSEALDELGNSFEFSAWSSLITNDDVAIHDNCPVDVDSTDLDTNTVAFPNDDARDARTGAVSSTRPTTSSSTTPAMTGPAPTQPTPTTGPTPPAPAAPKCPRTWAEPIHDLDLVAQCLYQAYREGDSGWAALFADQEALDTLFESPWEPPEWQFAGCEENTELPPYGTCYFTIEGEPHGVQVEMVMDGGVSAGITVATVEFYG